MKATTLIAALREPAQTPRWSLERWDELIREARRTNLLGRLASLLEDAGLLDHVPAAPRAHLQAANVVARAQEEAVRREVRYVRAALSRAGTEAILLKGAAYLFAGIPAARGRLFSDIDILVPRPALAEVEAALMLHGWGTTHHHPYDQRYYRRWSHELPPLRHLSRQTVLDVHHAILPPTARIKSDAQKLWGPSRPLAEDKPLRVLAPTDMVLHSATHLFYNEEFSNGLRDLVDIASLLRHFGTDAEFWNALPARALELGLERPLYYGLRYAAEVMGVQLPQSALRATQEGRPGWPFSPIMDRLFRRVLQASHPIAPDGRTALAQHALYVRAHWMRMPAGLLAYHLAVKAFRGAAEAPAAAR